MNVINMLNVGYISFF